MRPDSRELDEPLREGAALVLCEMHMRVTLEDVDGARLVYFGAPFNWSARVLSEWMAQLGRPLSGLFEKGVAIPVAETRTKFLRPVRQDEVVGLVLLLRNVGRTSFTLNSEVRGRDGAAAIITTTTHVYVQGLDGAIAPTPLPIWLRDALLGSVKERGR